MSQHSPPAFALPQRLSKRTFPDAADLQLPYAATWYAKGTAHFRADYRPAKAHGGLKPFGVMLGLDRGGASVAEEARNASNSDRCNHICKSVPVQHRRASRDVVLVLHPRLE